MKTRLLLLLAALGFTGSAQCAAPTCGLTIITHGLQPNGTYLPTYVREMADAIKARTGANIPIYRVRYDKQSGGTTADDRIQLEDGASSIDITSSGGAIILLDWAAASDETIEYPTQNVADRFFDYLFGQQHGGHYLAELPIHLIGHSRGCSLNSRLAYSLAGNGILVDQVTTLDPHPVTSGGGTDWVPETFVNVLFADNYYRTGAIPAGQPVPGARNSNLSATIGGTTISCTEHAEVHTYYHGTIALTATTDGDCNIQNIWYQQSTARDETGYNYSRYTNASLARPTSGVNQRISGGTGSGSRVPVDTAFQFWPNAGFDQRSSIPNRVTVGSTISIPYYFADRSSQQTITFSLDADTNPFNGVRTDIGSATQNSQPDGNIGSSSLSWTPTAADVGTHYIRVITTNTKIDLIRTRYDYFLMPIVVEAAATPRPTVSDVSPRTLLAAPSNVLTPIAITGTGFTSNSKLRYTRLDDGFTYPDSAPQSATATRLETSISVGLTPRSWSVRVVEGSAVSEPYTFYVVSGGVELTGLSIQGPATITESGNGQFSATALFNNGSQQASVTPVAWGVIGSGASINSSSGYLTASSVGANSPVTVTASYTSGGVTKSTSATVTIVDVGSGGGTQTQELIVNPQFSNVSLGWTATGNFYYDNRFASAYSLGGYAYLSNPEGTKGNGLTGQLDQTIQIPASATRVILSYWYRITTDETDGNPRDFMILRLIDSTGTTTVEGSLLSNLAANSAYQQHQFDITAFKGRTVTVSFYAPTSSAANPTTFRIDDVSVVATIPPPVTLVSLAINGPSSVAEGTSGTYYTATAIYSDGSTNLVTPTWQLNTSFGTLLSNGELRTDYVIADVATSITATFGNQTATKPVNIVNVAPAFSYLAISGPSSISENSSAQFTATAIFSDGSTQTASPAWNVIGTGATIGSSSGQLSAGEVSADTTVTVSASVTLAGVANSANQSVTIVNSFVPPTLTALSINGHTSVNENGTAQYTATASFSDGSSQGVNPTWSVGSTATSISVFGLLSAGEVASDTSVNVSASFISGGLTRSATKSVMVVNGTVTPQPGTVQFSSAAFSVSEGAGTATIAATRTGGSAGAVSVSYAAVNGTANAGADYTATSATLSWADGDTANKTFAVAILEDSLVEGNETVTLTLSNPSGGATLGAPVTATLTIADNESGGSVFPLPIPTRPTSFPLSAPASQGFVVAWGNNDSGQTNVPGGLSGVVAVAAGGGHSLALRSGGTVASWGLNTYGQVNVPSGLNGVVRVAAGVSASHSLALRSDGTVVAWGFNVGGQTNVPAGLSGVVAVAGGDNHSLALRSDGTVVGWGFNGNGQTAVPVAAQSGVVGVAAGYAYSLALREDGTIVAWGWNPRGQTDVPAGLSEVVAIAAGVNHCLALKRDGTVVTWGKIFNAPSFVNATVPVGLNGVVAVGVGTFHSLALKSDGTVVEWNADGSIRSAAPAALSGVLAVASGGSHNLTLVSPLPPAVSVSRSGSNLTMLWPDLDGGYRLETAPNFSPTNTWNNVGGMLQTNGGYISIVVPMLGSQKFYRLVKP